MKPSDSSSPGGSDTAAPDQASEEPPKPLAAPGPYELTADNIEKARVGDRVYVTGKGDLYYSYGHTGIITAGRGQSDRWSLRVRIPKSSNSSYEVDCDVCDPGDFADVFYEHAPIDFGDSTITVYGVISSINRGEETKTLFGVDLTEAVVMDVSFD